MKIIEKIQNLAKSNVSKNGNARGMIMIVIGGYISYLGITMVSDSKSGVSSMDIRQSVILMLLMLFVGIAVAAFGLLVLKYCFDEQVRDKQETDNGIDKEE